MATVIKATDRNAGIQGVAYNFTDMADEADRRLGKFRDEAASIIAKAKEEAELIRKQAREQGHKTAVEEVRAQLTQQQKQQLSTLLPALGKAIEDIQHAKQAWLAHWEKSAVHLATAIAERLIRSELPKKPELTVALAQEALQLAAGSGRIRVHLNPADHETLGPQIEENCTSGFPPWRRPNWSPTKTFPPAGAAWNRSSELSTSSSSRSWPVSKKN